MSRKKKTCSFELQKFSNELRQKRIDNLRDLRGKKSFILNFKAKLWATRLLHEQIDGGSIQLPKHNYFSDVSRHSVSDLASAGDTNVEACNNACHGKPGIASTPVEPD